MTSFPKPVPVIGVCTLFAGLWLGASVANAAATASADELAEVVVTAERVESNVQRTAISMEVLSSDELKSQGVTSITALSTVSPSVNVTGYGGGTVVTVRGISSRDTTEVGDPAVVVSQDGFYQDRAYALGLAQYDMERIEILRGPQGTLYGRNATGGAINIYTTRPGKDSGGYVLLEGGNYDTLNAEGAVNVPLSDRVQMRASFLQNYHGAYRTDGGIYGGVDDANARSGRLQLAWQPTDSFSLRVTGQHTVQTALGSQPQQAPYVVDANGWVIHNVLPALSDPKGYTKYAPSQLNLNDNMLRYDMTYRAPFTTITYLGGFDQLSWNSINPGAFYGLPTGSGPATAANPNPAFQVRQYNQTEKPETINQELRFTSPNQDARFTWQAGVYYFRNHNTLDSFNFAPNGTASPTPVIHFIYDVKIKSVAEMAQASFKVTDTLKLTGGVRHNADSKDRLGYIFFAQVLPATAVPTHTTGDVNKDTYSLGIDWQWAPANLLYAKYGTGYKSGGFTDIAPYGPESIKTAEVGSKNRFFDNRFEANVAIYHSDYTGQQVQQIVSGGGGLRIVNAGATRLQGAELDFAWALAATRIEFDAAYLDAKFTDFALPASQPRWNGTAWVTNYVGAPGVPGSPDFGPNAVIVPVAGSPTTPNVQLAGNRPQQAPEWTFGAALQHAWGPLTARVSTKYQSEQFYTFFNTADSRQKPYALTNVSLTYQADESKWMVMAYVNNVTDETVFSNAGANDRNFDYAYSYLPPRTWGGRVQYRW